jgi:translation initiation factor IF-3
VFVRYNIDIHDYSVRLRAAKKFLKAGDKVITIILLLLLLLLLGW